MLIKDLPEVIKKRALEYLDKQQLQGYVVKDFLWYETAEGNEVWHHVSKGNFQPFYDFHKISPVAEWVPKEWEIVEVSGAAGIWVKAEYIGKHRGLYVVYVLNIATTERYSKIRKPVVKLTRTEIAKKFGVSKDFEFVEE